VEFCSQLYALADITPGRADQYTIDRRFGGLQSRPGCCGKMKYFPCAGNRSPEYSLVAISNYPNLLPVTEVRLLTP